jgi:chromosome segregation ATPase
MKSVEKYNWTEGGMLEYADGKYVQHDDYAALRADLDSVDAVLGGRDALADCPTRVDKILRCIETAKQADALRADIEAYQKKLADGERYWNDLQADYRASILWRDALRQERDRLAVDLEEWKGVVETSAKEAAKYIQDRDRLRDRLGDAEGIIAAILDGLDSNGYPERCGLDENEWETVINNGRKFLDALAPKEEGE